MTEIKNLEPKRVFKYFEEISQVPRGSGNMNAIAEYCVDFAKKHSLKYIRDAANNVIIYKNATKGFENAPSVILQGHLDMVCQKESGYDIDFESQGLKIYADGDFLKAEGTTLGGDNGIAVAMVLAILESDVIPHPAIEAVFTTDEEIGMLGAVALDMKNLSSKVMINIDSEDQDIVTVSCAGGLRFSAEIPFNRQTKCGTAIKIVLKGLKGGHSGVEIDKGRVNADILAGRVLNHLKHLTYFEIISINGGDKDNAITPTCEILLLSENGDSLIGYAESYLKTVKAEISAREPDFCFEITTAPKAEHGVIDKETAEKLIYFLTLTPNGVIDMSAEINGLVETSLNLGILQTNENTAEMHYALRSNKKTSLEFLSEKMKSFFEIFGIKTNVSGAYPPWEFNPNSKLQTVYTSAFKEQFGYEPKIEAIHAGLECGVFSDAIDGIDCISIGPQMYDIHTVNERLSITSVEKIYNLLLNVLSKLK